MFPHPLFYFQNKHSSQQLFLRFYDKRIRPAAGVLDNKGSSLRSDPQESGSACSPLSGGVQFVGGCNAEKTFVLNL